MTTGRSNMDLGMVLTTVKEQPWSKAGVSENLTWLVDQTRVFTTGCRTSTA
jgi:hypothetical protein